MITVHFGNSSKLLLTDRLLTINEVIVSIQLLLDIVGVLVVNLGPIEVIVKSQKVLVNQDESKVLPQYQNIEANIHLVLQTG